MLKDAFLPPPFGDTRATWIINGGVYHEEADARLAAREAGLSATDADDYVRMLYAEYARTPTVTIICGRCEREWSGDTTANRICPECGNDGEIEGHAVRVDKSTAHR